MANKFFDVYGDIRDGGSSAASRSDFTLGSGGASASGALMVKWDNGTSIANVLNGLKIIREEIQLIGRVSRSGTVICAK